MKNQEEKIPEYVECIKELPHYNDYGELGKIYKVLDWNCSITDCMLVGTTSGSTAKKRFKPSTKEAYEAQNTYLKAADYVPQVGDYVVMEKAGGWGYSPDNNGCVAIISQISNTVIEHIKGSSVTFSISGEVINPNKDRAVKFSSVPQFGYDKEVIFRKALPHEIPDVPESPLEICRKKYKKGMLVRSAKEYGEYSGEFIIDVDPSEFYYTGGGVDYFASRGWLYINGKFADILEESKEKSIIQEDIEFHAEMERKSILDNLKQEPIIYSYPITPENAFPVKAIQKQIKKNKFQEVHEIKTVEEKLLKKTKSKLFNI